MNYSMTTGHTQADGKTDWEEVAKTKWGTYISEIEKSSILTALSLAPKPSVALDVGCGKGRWSQLVHNADWKVICTDIYQRRLDICKTRIPSSKCILVDPGSSELPCKSGSIGLILGIEVPFVTHSNWFISEAYRVLHTDGLMVIITFNRRSWRGSLAHVSARLRGSYDYYERSYGSRKEQLTRGGFTVRHQTGFCWFPFSRSSDSFLVPFAGQLERYLGLRRLANFSPWVAVVAQKTRQDFVDFASQEPCQLSKSA